jgi:hypothetical protein
MPLVPAPTLPRLLQTLAAGLAGLVLWEAFARLVAPLWIGFVLDPTGLLQMAFGVSGAPAEVLHLLIGLVAFPAGYVFLFGPALGRIGAAPHWVAPGLIWGAVLWVVAMYIVASLIGGAPAFMGFQPVAWASLVGHLLVGLGIAGAAAHLPALRA